MSKAIASYEAKASSVQELLRFAFDGLEVRVVDREGNPWFVAKDVCGALGHRDVKQALSRLPDPSRATIKLPDRLGREQPTTIISLGGLFRLALTSRVDGAERFQSWITDEVLPQIYRTGTYGTTARIAELEAQLARRAEQVSVLTQALVERRTLTVPEADLSALSEQLHQLTAQVARLTARLDTPLALPAPVTDGLHPLGPGQVLIRDGAPVELRAAMAAQDEDLAAAEAAFVRAYPDHHLAPAAPTLKPDWRWSRGPVVRVVAGPLPRAVDVQRLCGTVVRNARGVEAAVEAPPGAALEAIRAEAQRLGFMLGPWRTHGGRWRARIMHTCTPQRTERTGDAVVVRSLPIVGSIAERGVVLGGGPLVGRH